MSKTNIPVKVRLLLSARAAGRCQFRGCNRSLTQHQLTRHKTRFGAYAHIVADSPNGPRGDAERSPGLAKDIKNLMLLCPDCHKNVDENWEDFPEDLLLNMKAEHEARVCAVTEPSGLVRTHLLLFDAGIGNRAGQVQQPEAAGAALPRWAYERSTEIRLGASRLQDGERAFWEVGIAEVGRAVDEVKRDFAERRMEHTSVFAIGPIPLLVWLGYRLGDVIPGEAFQLSRGDHRWNWLGNGEELEISLDDETPVPAGEAVVLLLSVSGEVDVPPELDSLTRRRVDTRRPGLDIVQTRAQVQAFKSVSRRAMAAVSGAAEVHVVPALPNSLAVEFGRLQLPKAHPPLVIWERNDARGGLSPALMLKGGEAHPL